MKRIHQLTFCYFFFFGLTGILAQQARQLPFYTSSLGYSISQKKLIVFGHFSLETERKNYSIDPATLKFVPIADNAIPTDIVNNFHPDYKSSGLLSVKDDDRSHLTVYQPPFHATFLDTINNLLYLPLNDDGSLTLFIIDPIRLTLQRKISLPDIPVADMRFFTQLPGGISFAYAIRDRIIIIQECTTAVPYPESDLEETIAACEINGPAYIYPPTGYDHLYYYNKTNYETLDQHIYADSMPTTEEGIYDLRVADADGCLSQSKSLTLKHSATPATPIFKALSPRGDMVLVDGTSDTTPQCEEEMTMLAASQTHFNSNIFYVWSNRDTGRVIYTKEPGVYWVEAHNADGCKSKRSNELVIYKLDKPIPIPPPILPLGDSLDICRTEATTILQTKGDYTAFVWYTDKTKLPSKGPTLSVEKNESKIYIRGRKEGCWSDFASEEVYFSFENSFPATINRLEHHLVSNKNGQAYRWYHNEVLLPDSNKIAWEAEAIGAYQVSVFNGVCWTRLSAKVFIP